ncbi:class I adenylate-forming enzyme family protein [Bradyrhizobium sp. 13971]
MIYTSGSTGRPKGAMLSYRNVIFKTAATVTCNGIGAEDVLLSIAPLYHIAGMVMGVNAPVYAGATSVLLYRFDPLVTAQAIDRYQVSWWYSVAPMNVAVTQLPNISDFRLKSLRVNPVTSFGIDWTEALAGQWQAVASNCESFEAAYGLTETHTVDTFMPRNAIRWGTHGRPVPGNEIRIVDPDSGTDMPAGVPGEIVIHGPGVFKGYRNRPDATAEALRNGWLHTGDMGRLDADGYLTFMGRFKEMIKVSGYSVFPEEVEFDPEQAPRRGGVGRDRRARRNQGRSGQGLHRPGAARRAGHRPARGMGAPEHGALQGAARCQLRDRVAALTGRQAVAAAAQGLTQSCPTGRWRALEIPISSCPKITPNLVRRHLFGTRYPCLACPFDPTIYRQRPNCSLRHVQSRRRKLEHQVPATYETDDRSAQQRTDAARHYRSGDDHGSAGGHYQPGRNRTHGV